MKIYIFRHAERDFSTRENPSLSTNGQQQALNLIHLVVKNQIDKPALLLSSPKKRAQESFLPLKKQLNIPLKIIEELDERKSIESAHDFQNRVKLCLQKLEKQNSNLFVVSHHDWLEEAMPLIPTSDNLNTNHFLNWQTMQYAEFLLQDGLWQLQRTGRITDEKL